jgi:glycosyltransferase involved in cell wall biosynthesis
VRPSLEKGQALLYNHGMENGSVLENDARAGTARKPVDLVVPCYNEAGNVRRFHEAVGEVSRSLPGYEFRLIFVDDGSADGTLDAIRALAREDGRVRYVSLSRNFGKEAAMYAGLRRSTAPLSCVIDADLQHPPALLREMIFAVDEEGYDSCAARRVTREGEPRIRSAMSRMFYRVINRMSDVEIVDGSVDFRLMSRRMLDAVLSLTEVQRFSKGIFAWVGFNTKWVEFHNTPRVAGETKWSFWKLLSYAVGGIASFSTAPLRFASFVGAAFLLMSLVLAGFEFVKTLVRGVAVPGYPSTFIMLLLIGGVVSLSCGILGEYVGRMYLETKRRPVYIEKETNFGPGAAAGANPGAGEGAGPGANPAARVGDSPAARVGDSPAEADSARMGASAAAGTAAQGGGEA